MTRRHASLLHRRGGEGGKSDDVPGRIDAGHARLIGLVDQHQPALPHLHAHSFEPEVLCVARSTGRPQQDVRGKLISIGALNPNVIIARLDRVHRVAESDVDLFLTHRFEQQVTTFHIDKGQNLRARLDQRHLHANLGEHARVLAPDDAAAHHDHRSRHAVQFKYAVGVHHARMIKGNVIRLNR